MHVLDGITEPVAVFFFDLALVREVVLGRGGGISDFDGVESPSAALVSFLWTWTL